MNKTIVRNLYLSFNFLVNRSEKKKYLNKLFVSIIVIIMLLTPHLVLSQHSDTFHAQAIHLPGSGPGFEYSVDFECRYTLDRDVVNLHVKPIKVYNVGYYIGMKFHRDLSFLSKYDSRLSQPLQKFVESILSINLSGRYNIVFKQISDITWNTTFGNVATGSKLMQREIDDIKDALNDSRGWQGGATVSIHSIEFYGQKNLEESINAAYNRYFDDLEKENNIQNKELETSESVSLNTNKMNNDINSSNASITLKKPYEYSKQEFDNLSVEDQKRSLQVQLDSYESDIVRNLNDKNIDKNLQQQGYASLNEGDYLAAAQTFNEAGDYTNAMSAGATGIAFGILNDIKENKLSSIRHSRNELNLVAEEIKEEENKANDNLKKGDFDSYYRSQLKIMRYRIKAFARMNRLYKVSKSDRDLEAMSDYVDFSIAKNKQLLNSDILSDKQKVQLYFNDCFSAPDHFFKNLNSKVDEDNEFEMIGKFFNLDEELQKQIISNSLFEYYLHYSYVKERKIYYTYYQDIMTSFDDKLYLICEQGFDYHFNPIDYNKNFVDAKKIRGSGHLKNNGDLSFFSLTHGSNLFLPITMNFIYQENELKLKESGFSKRSLGKIWKEILIQHGNHGLKNN